MSDFIKAKEAIEIFGISRATLWNWVKKGIIKQYNITDKTVFYKRSELIAMFDNPLKSRSTTA
ncbi:helix-turn-helix transcriptional regulator [Campylobacter iguaniorum]|uniref:helix-turn-helix transcriptional regulator n=1 Tax=Campylobacter iguaniorum TaxID=1244531 RepID=UPI00073A3845|nr:helix-turn-helix domain-containing protein [Campylobacter iguaniorum]